MDNSSLLSFVKIKIKTVVKIKKKLMRTVTDTRRACYNSSYPKRARGIVVNYHISIIG